MVKFNKENAVKKLRSVGAAIDKKIAPVAVGASAALSSVAVTACAEEGVFTLALAEINSSDVLANMQPFVNAAIPILAVVGGVKLGRNFLRSAFH